MKEQVKELLFYLSLEDLEEIKRFVDLHIDNRKRRIELTKLLNSAKP